MESKKTTRVQFELPEKSMKRLQELKDKTEASSYAEVVKNAIRLYEDIINKHEEGFEFFIEEKESNQKIKYVILN